MQQFTNHYFFTAARLQAHPLTQGFVSEFAELRPLIDTAAAEERTLLENRRRIEAVAQVLDDGLDGIVDGVDSTLRIELRNDRCRGREQGARQAAGLAGRARPALAGRSAAQELRPGKQIGPDWARDSRLR